MKSDETVALLVRHYKYYTMIVLHIFAYHVHYVYFHSFEFPTNMKIHSLIVISFIFHLRSWIQVT